MQSSQIEIIIFILNQLAHWLKHIIIVYNIIIYHIQLLFSKGAFSDRSLKLMSVGTVEPEEKFDAQDLFQANIFIDASLLFSCALA